MPDDREKILPMFRQGYDTYAIGNTLGMDEWMVERYLHAAMAAERFRKEKEARKLNAEETKT